METYGFSIKLEIGDVMNKITRTLIIIYDNYENVLVVQRNKDKNNSQGTWSLVGKDLKGKENEEKCITKAVDNELGCLIFNLTPLREYIVNEDNGEGLRVYTGIIRERINLHKTINKAEWICEEKLDSYTFSVKEKEILMNFFNNESKGE
jgi:hypothetical protein